MKCPWCLTDNLILAEDTQCCEDCGGSFMVVCLPEPILLDDKIRTMMQVIKSYSAEKGFDHVRGLSKIDRPSMPSNGKDKTMPKIQMGLPDFLKIGDTFYLENGNNKKYLCTDIGTRTITAIELDPTKDPSWYIGPTYAVAEIVFNADDFPVIKKE